MTTPPTFQPTWQWHLKVWGVLLVACIAAFYICSYVSKHLPAAYQQHTATPETTPWLHTEVHP